MKHKISVSALVICEGKLLMLKEIQDGQIAWDIPAGGCDEDIRTSVVREVLEETGLEIQNPKLIRIFEFVEKDRLTVNFLFISFLEQMPEVLQNQQVEGEEILDIQFFGANEVRNMLPQAEHNLARARLSVFLDDDFEPNLNPICTKED